HLGAHPARAAPCVGAAGFCSHVHYYAFWEERGPTAGVRGPVAGDGRVRAVSEGAMSRGEVVLVDWLAVRKERLNCRKVFDGDDGRARMAAGPCASGKGSALGHGSQALAPAGGR